MKVMADRNGIFPTIRCNGKYIFSIQLAKDESF